MIKNSVSRLYTGISHNPNHRLIYHNSKLGAKFTKHTPIFRLVFVEQYATIGEARKREIQIKRWQRDKKEKLIQRFQRGLETKPM